MFVWKKVFKTGPSKFFYRLSSISFTWSILEYFVPYKFSHPFANPKGSFILPTRFCFDHSYSRGESITMVYNRVFFQVANDQQVGSKV